MTTGLFSIYGKKGVFLLPKFVSKPAQSLTQTFTHLLIAVTLCVIPCVDFQVQALKYYGKLFPGVWVAKSLMKGNINLF